MPPSLLPGRVRPLPCSDWVQAAGWLTAGVLRARCQRRGFEIHGPAAGTAVVSAPEPGDSPSREVHATSTAHLRWSLPCC